MRTNIGGSRVIEQLVVRYLQSVAPVVRESDPPPAGTELAGVEAALRGQKPAAVALDTTEVTGTVEAIG
jgi:hypothetical protein